VIRIRLLTAAAVAVLLASLTGTSLAQDGTPVLEDTDWSLVTYYDEEAGEFSTVPFEVRPTLRLESGTSTGFGGCNSFTGGYDVDGSSLTFGEELSVTLAFCEGPAQEVEDAYLAGLGQIGSWAIDERRLELYDNLGDLVLAFEVPGITWTPTQLATLLGALEGLQTEIDTLRDDTDSLNVPKLRQRIKALESENKKLTQRLTKLEDTPKADPAPNSQANSLAFNAAEKVLLKGIPTRIAKRCTPLRSQLPKGTQAAVTCRPNTKVVTSVDYFLLEGSRAVTEFGSVMTEYNVPEATAKTCADGTKSQQLLLGNGWQADGCYREYKTAQLRFVDNATDCQQLKVAGRTLESPAIYMALTGSDQNVARVHEWATKGLDAGSGQLTSITQYIPSNAAPSPACAS
jgi:heat shock protein HslJ